MLPKTMITAESSEDGVLLLQGKGAYSFSFLGASVQASVSPDGREFMNSCSLLVPKGEKGVVAIRGAGEHGSARDFLISFCWEEGGPLLDLDSNWIPPADRLLQVAGVHLQLFIPGSESEDPVVYTADPKMKDVSGYRLVPDGNLLCRFAVGKIDREELEQAAVEPEVTLEQMRLDLHTLLRAIRNPNIRRIVDRCAKGKPRFPHLSAWVDAMYNDASYVNGLFSREELRDVLRRYTEQR